jgi:hypothetical protein
MKRSPVLSSVLALALAYSFLLLADGPALGDTLEETYAPWLNRLRVARVEMDKLKAERQKAQVVYDDILSQWRVRGSRIDPEKEAQASAAIKELEQRIQDKEYEINTTIPDEARRAGVPSSILSQ